MLSFGERKRNETARDREIMVRDLQTVKRKVKRFERHLREKVQLVGVLVPVIGKMVRFLCFSFRPLGLRPRRRLTKKALDQEGISPIRANLTPTGGVDQEGKLVPYGGRNLGVLIEMSTSTK